MIEVKVTKNGVRMSGHAGYHENGTDLVCAAVSALTCGLVNALQMLTNNRIRADTGNGRTVIEWEELTESGRLLVDAWFLGLVAVDQEHPCITFV